MIGDVAFQEALGRRDAGAWRRRPMTVACLLVNTLRAACAINELAARGFSDAHFRRVAMTVSRAIGLLLLPVDTFDNEPVGFVGIAPAQHLTHLPEILVVLEEVLDLLQRCRGGRLFFTLSAARVSFDDGTAMIFVAAGLVFHQQHADRTHAHQGARHRAGVGDQDVAGRRRPTACGMKP
jgi:hypothetical protein